MSNKDLINKTKEYYQKKYDNIYNPRAVKAALYYSKKYNLDYGNNSTYNNEADAFKHTYASALVSLEEGYFISLAGGFEHERSNKNNNKSEYNMDVNNNGIGRQIAREIKFEYGSRWHKLNDKEKDEIIAQKVYDRMQKGDIILNPSGRRKLKNAIEKWDKHGNVTYKNKDLFKDYTDEEIWDNYVRFEENKFFNPKNRVFHNDEYITIAKSPKNSYDDSCIPQMLKQYYENNYHLPSREELEARVHTGELICVHEYVRSDGTKVSGYYRAYPKG